MSGIDIAGLALGVLPLFVYAAGHYRNSLEPYIVAVNPRARDRKLAVFYRDLHFEVTLLHELLKRLFEELPGHPRPRADSLLENLKIDNSPLANSLLRERLGDAYQSFLEVLENSLRYLNHLVKDKGMSSSETRSHEAKDIFAKLLVLQRDVERGENIQDREGLTNFRDRIRFSTSDSRRQKSLNALTSNNKKLESLLQIKTARAEPSLIQGGLQRNGPPGAKIRKLLHDLYDTMSRCWLCDNSRHQAMLSLLKGCVWPHSDEPQETDVQIVVSTHQSPDQIWQESEVSIIAPATGVRFSDEPTSPTNTARHHVNDLCPLIHLAQENQCHLSMGFNGSELWHIGSKQRLPIVRTTRPEVTLAKLFEQQPRARVTLREKRLLAVVLARSLLQFCESPWLAHDWNKRHIAFLADTINDRTDLQRPYLSTCFDDPDESTLTETDELFLMHPNPSVLALGILLIEIDQWQRIEDHRPEGHLLNGKVNVNTDLTTAMRLLEDFSDDLYENHKSAIDACLSCKFTTESKVSLEDAAFRQGIYDNIIYPLEVELFHGFQTTIADF